MYLSIRLDDDSVELMQSDIEDMWNYLEQDTENFVYHTASYIGGLELEYYAAELRPLYETLKNFFENE